MSIPSQNFNIPSQIVTTSHLQIDTAIPREDSHISNKAVLILSNSSSLSSISSGPILSSHTTSTMISTQGSASLANVRTNNTAATSSVSVRIISSTIGSLSSQASSSVATSSPALTPTIPSLNSASGAAVSPQLSTGITTTDTRPSVQPLTSSSSSSSSGIVIDDRKDPIEMPKIAVVKDVRPPIASLSFKSVDADTLPIHNFSEWRDITYKVIRDLNIAYAQYKQDKAQQDKKAEAHPAITRVIDTPALENMSKIRHQLRILRLRLFHEFKINNSEIDEILRIYDRQLFQFLLCPYHEDALEHIKLQIENIRTHKTTNR